MLDNSKEGLMSNNPKKISFSSSFDPISEKQEEMSIGSLEKNNKPKAKEVKPKNINRNSFINSKKYSKEYSKFTKDILDDADFIKHSVTLKSKKSWLLSNQKKINFLNQLAEYIDKKDETENINTIKRSYKKKHSKKKIKRNSVEERGYPISNIVLPQSNHSERKDKYLKKNSIKKQFHHLNSINTSYFSKTIHNRENNSLIKKYSNAKSISNEGTIEMHYINKIGHKKTVLHKGKITVNDNKSKNNFLEQIKNSDLYEKSEILIIKLKIAYILLAIFSLICLILNFADVIIYNNKSIEYLIIENNNTYISFRNNIESYYKINNRKISSKENNIRVFNGIFSLICTCILIIIHYISNGKNEDKKKNSKKERFKRILDHYYSKQRKKSVSKNKLKKLEQEAKNEKIKVVNLTPNNKDFKNKATIKYERNITIMICIINIIFYPPCINKSFVGKYNNIIYIYSLNSLFLIISLYKIINIYISILYLSSINNSFNKAICKSNLINLDSSFLLKYKIKKYPILFFLLNIIMLSIAICIVLFCIEYFSIDINQNYWNTNIEDKADIFFNIFYSFLFFITRNIHEHHNIKSFLGKILLYIGGIIGMLVSSYFIYYINTIVQFSPEEQDAYSKLSKLLEPMNKEHKASNLIKSFLLLKKNIRDNQNTEKDYRLKKEDLNRPTLVQRKPIFQRNNTFQFEFNSNITNNNLNLNDTNNEEKRKFIKYIGKKFLFKIKFTVECKNFIDNLKIARNSAQSFKDVLKTVGNKMEVNISQLNNKIEVLIQNDKKFLNFIKFNLNTLKHIRKINNYHNNTMQYFVEIHNEYVKQMIELKKEIENNSPLLTKNSKNFPKRMKSNIFGNLNFKNTTHSKIILDNKRKKKKTKKRNI